MALTGSGKRHISPQLYAGTCGQARRPLRHPGGGHSGRLHPVSAPGRRSLPPQIPGGKGMEPSATCRPCKGQPDKHPLLGDRTENHQPKVFPASGRKSWARFSFYAAHVRYGNFSPAKRKSSSASHDMWQRRRAFVMESFCFSYPDICSILHNIFFYEHKSFYFSKSFFYCSIRTVSIRSFSKKMILFCQQNSQNLCNTKSPTLNTASESDRLWSEQKSIC